VTAQERRDWMALWCARNTAALALDGSVGFGRDCVGVLVGDSYPDYIWHGDEAGDYKRLDGNGDVWTPDDAYHKHDCVAVLGHGEGPEELLYHWLKWFDDNGFAVESGVRADASRLHPIQIAMGQARYCRMVRAEVAS